MVSAQALRFGLRIAVATCVASGVTACSGVYDPALLDPPTAGSSGGVGVAASGGMGGTPSNMGCGDAIVGGGELCDTGIAAGQFGACPTACADTSADPCVKQLLAGTGCMVECVNGQVPACGSGDGCCPPTCTHLNDMDCSMDCGDGVVDATKGETCEPSTAQDCPMDCDDGDPCTTDSMTGSRQNCNVLCAHPPLTTFADDDGCCPTGGNAGNDTDCGSTPEQDACMALVDASDACAVCACLSCTSQSMACFGGTDTTANMQCEAVVECARANGCKGNDCYCGMNLGTCLMMPEGPCATEITAAAGDMMMVSEDACATGNPLGDSVSLGNCADTNCAAECPARTGTVSPCP